ncbi:MAG TPA: carbon-nitrogen hydrolase family protein [Candidatus Latescibacteria bacterium]|nr:carbon-nitrogen hydrolase family protein [Candidatus Latescibacterota bacterium]
MTSEQPQRAGRPFVLASCSILPEKWNKEENARKMLSFMERSLRCGADVIAVPEGCLEGYVVMEAIEANRGTELLNIAEPEDGEMIARFRGFCQKHRVHALVCFCERERNEAFNTALWIGRNGETVGKYRKTHLNEGYNADHRFNCTGAEIRAFDTEFGRAGVMICFDRRVPEVARCLALDGAQFILNPSYGVYKGWNDSVLAARAHENQIPVVFVHPNKTLAVNEKGDITFCREETDVISHLTVTPRTSSSLLLSLRRPQLYGRITSLT